MTDIALALDYMTNGIHAFEQEMQYQEGLVLEKEAAFNAAVNTLDALIAKHSSLRAAVAALKSEVTD